MAVRMASRTAFALTLLCFAAAACSSGQASDTGGGKAGPKTSTGSDEGAMADLQASEEWQKPRCRWAETGAHVLAYPQDTEVLKAAQMLGWIDMEQVGTGNRTGRPEPAWKISLTAAGKAESAKCGEGSTRSTTFGVPVSQRRFISGKRTTEPDVYNPTRTMFDVQFEWVPTQAGDIVKYALTDRMAVEQGLATARVAMLHGERVVRPGANGWRVQAIVDERPKR